MINLKKVEKQEEKLLQHLIQFYIYEFSKYNAAIQLEKDGTYKPFELSDYWTGDMHHAYFIRLDTKVIGFALVESIQEENTMLEFFILAGYQGKGFGKAAATKVFEAHEGEWSVSQIEKNHPAQAFWRNLISDITNGEMEEVYKNRKYVQKFHTSAFCV